MARRARRTSSGGSGGSTGTDIGSKIDGLNDAINDLIDTIERNSNKNVINNNHNNGGSGNTSNRSRGVTFSSLSRYASNVKYRQQKLDQFSKSGQVMGRYMSINSKKLGTKFAGMGKAGAAATKAIGGLGKAVGVVSKFMGGPLVSAILLAVDALQKIGEGMNDWKHATADMYENQTKQEQFQYERSKQQMLIENQMKIENISAQGDLQMNLLETQGATMLEALKITTSQYAKSIEVAIGPLTKGINETAYDAAMSRIDTAAQIEKLGLHAGQREQKYQRFEEKRELQKLGKIAGLEAEKGVVETQYTTQSRQAALDLQQKLAREYWIQNILRTPSHNNINTNGNEYTQDNLVGNRNVVTGERMNIPTNTRDVGVEDVDNPNAFVDAAQKFIGYQAGQQALNQAVMHNMNQVITQEADYNKTYTDARYQLAQTEKDYAVQIADKQLDIAVESKEIVIDTAAQIKKTWLQLAQNNEKWLENFDNITNDLGINLGYTSKNQLHDYQTSMFNIVENVAAKFGKSIEEVSKIQQSFVETTGRNRMMGEHDYGQLLGLSKYLGNDDALAAQYSSEMEIFNTGIDDSVDMLGEVLQDVNKIGLNGRKYTKTLVDNLKMAQKYNFKGGTKGLMEMAKWAENTRFNLSSLGGMLDKISEGGLEGVITQGAQFQVLGGHAAMNADPIAMMYERYANPQAFARRMQDMTKGFGQLDKKTGETYFSGNEQMLMEQIAKVQGRSLEEVMNEVRARNKREVVAKQISNNFNEDQQAFISNNATYNKETGQFQVKVKGANGEYVDKDVSKLTPEDLKQIMPEGHNERMEKYMQDITSAVESMKGTEIAMRANQAAATYEEMLNEYTERTRIANESYAKNRDQYIEETKAGMDAATQSFHDYIGIFENGNSEVDASVRNIEEKANAIGSELENTARIIELANRNIARAGGIEYNAPTSSGRVEDMRNPNRNNQTIPLRPNDTQAPTWPWQQRREGSSVLPTQPQLEYNNNPWMNDGIVKSKNNSPMVTQASNVTKINDGLVQSNPKDVAIFAKEGGVIGNFLAGLRTDVNSAMGGNIKMDAVDVRISGNLDLSSGGQSVNIIGELQNNPTLLRSLSRMLSQQISSAMNGGRGISELSVGM